MAADVLNDWVGYLDRSYQTIKTSVLARVTTANPEMTDHNSSNPFIILLDVIAATLEMLGYYVDNVARETFIGTAIQRSSIIKHSVLLDYRIKARSSESVDVVITWTNGSGTPTNTPSEFTLQQGSSITSDEGITYRLPQDIVIPVGTATSQIAFEEYSQITNLTIGTSDGNANQEISLGTSYKDGSIQVVINSITWLEVETFANLVGTDLHFKIDIREDGNAYIVFGDDINGSIPTNSLDIIVDYQTTLGEAGEIAASTLTQAVTFLGLPVDTDATTTNPNNSSGGSDYESDRDIAVNSINSVKTLSRAVTFEDYKIVTESYAGVGRAAAAFDCGKTIDVYIVPTGGGIASASLVSDVQDFLDTKKMVTTFPIVKAAGEDVVKLQMTVTAKKRSDTAALKTAVDAALLSYGEVKNRNINGNVRISDLQALVDNVDNVDFVDLDYLYILPYARPVDHTNVLVWTNETTALSTTVETWKLQYDQGNTEMRLFKNGAYVTNIPIDTEYDTLSGFKLEWSAGSYTDTDEWTFKTYPYTTNISISDFSIPTTKVSSINTIVKPYSPQSENIIT